MAAEADHLRHGQPGPGDHGGGGGGGARRRHHGDGALRLSQPGQQCARLPLHLPRRARRARDRDQHGDEDRGRARAGRSCARGRARRGRRRLWRAAEIRARLHHSRAVRSAADLLRSRRRWPRRPWIPAWRASRSPTWTPTGWRLRSRRDPVAGVLQRVFERLAPAAQAGRVRRGRGGAGDPRRGEFRRRGAWHRAACRPRGPGTRDRRTRSASNSAKASRSSMPALSQPQRRLRQLPVRAAAAPRLSVPRLPAPDQTRTATISPPAWSRSAMPMPW